MDIKEISVTHESEMYNVARELCEINKREKVLLARYDQLNVILNIVQALDESKDKDKVNE